MSIPGDNSGLNATHPPRDDAKDLIRSVIVMLRIWGKITKQESRAEGIAISVLNATEGR